MANIDELQLFILISDLQDLASAACAMSITQAAASIMLSQLENRLGVTLFDRSNRGYELTEEGKRYMEIAQHARKILAVGGNPYQDAGSQALKIAAPVDLGRNVLLELLIEQGMEEPLLHIELYLSDAEEDLRTARFDAALRFSLGKPIGLIELPVLKQHNFVVCAAPDYLERNPTLITPEDLMKHNCIVSYTDGSPGDSWSFYRSGTQTKVRVKGAMSSNSSDAARLCAIAGLGIVYLPLISVSEDLSAKRLIPLLTDWQGEKVTLSFVVLHHFLINNSLRRLQQALAKKCDLIMKQHLTEFGH